MITRAGLAGLGAGLAVSLLLIYPLYILIPGLFIEAWPQGSWGTGMFLYAVSLSMLFLGGAVAALWSGAQKPLKRVGLGALAGCLSALLVFYNLSAATAGALGLSRGSDSIDSLIRIVEYTHTLFWAFTLSGITFGALGGWAATREGQVSWTTPSLRDPQMALNASLTAVPSAAVAIILAVAGFAGWPVILQQSAVAPLVRSPYELLNCSLGTGMLLFLAAQLALAGVTPHETRAATHRCGLDEVKMAALIGIFTPLALAVILGWLDFQILMKPIVLGGLIISLGFAGWQARILVTRILPRRAELPAPTDRVEAFFFGTIGGSRGGPLMLLCLGCGIVMSAPTYIVVAAAPISISYIQRFVAAPVDAVKHLYLAHAAAGMGSSLAAALLLALLYLFYSGLGRWFRRMRAKKS